VKHVTAVAEYLGFDLTVEQHGRLQRYREWLRDEAIPSGGMGPGEIARLEIRHLADSLLFGEVMPATPVDVLDLGTGVGLPGIPLAIVLPDTRFTLVDRSQRRLDLLRRALRILELGNCETLLGEIEDIDRSAEVVVARASLRPSHLAPLIPTLLRDGGVAIVGGSWQHSPRHEGWETVEIPRHVLDRSVWLLMMRRA